MERFRIDKKKMVVLGGMLALIFSVGMVSNHLMEKQALETTAGYAEYEQEQADLHDGMVLVDSISLRAVAGTADGLSGQPGTTSGAAAGQAEATAGAIQETAIATVTSDELSELNNPDNYFDEVRATINMDRNEVLSMLTDVIAEAESTGEKDNATQQKMKIIGYMDAENTIESLIENKGFTEALVVITDSSVTVTINKPDLNQSDVAKISDIVMRETGRSADQIVIQGHKGQ